MKSNGLMDFDFGSDVKDYTEIDREAYFPNDVARFA